MKIPECLTYICDPDVYLNPVRAALTLGALKQAVEPWQGVFPDAFIRVESMSDDDFTEYQWLLAHSKKEYKQKQILLRLEQAIANVGCVLIPKRMLEAVMVAQHFGVPWGCAVHRLIDKEVGR